MSQTENIQNSVYLLHSDVSDTDNRCLWTCPLSTHVNSNDKRSVTTLTSYIVGVGVVGVGVGVGSVGIVGASQGVEVWNGRKMFI